MLLKSTITLGLILTGLLFSCKKQDGYSDEIQTNPNPVTVDSTGNSSDSTSINNTGPAGISAESGGVDRGAGNSGAQSINAENAGSGSTGSGIQALREPELKPALDQVLKTVLLMQVLQTRQIFKTPLKKGKIKIQLKPKNKFYM